MGNCCCAGKVKQKNQGSDVEPLVVGMGDPACSEDHLHMVVDGAATTKQHKTAHTPQVDNDRVGRRDDATKENAGQAAVQAPTPDAQVNKPKEKRKGIEIEASCSLEEVSALPQGAVKWKLVSVYDGDTITVADPNDTRQRPDWVKIRLLGIDTPEIKDKESFAHEARRRLMVLLMGEEAGGKYFNLVEQNSMKGEGEKGKLKVVKVQGTIDVYVVEAASETAGAAQDRYGRHIGTIYAKNEASGKFLNLNATMIEEGLAKFYEPFAGAMSQDVRDLFLRCQRIARTSRANVWANVNENMVVLRTVNGRAFHGKDCEHLARSHPQKLTLGQALDEGLSSCRTCQPL